MTWEPVLTIIRVLTLVTFVIALVAAIEPAHVIGVTWPGWTDAGLLGLAISLLLPTLR